MVKLNRKRHIPICHCILAVKFFLFYFLDFEYQIK